MIHHVHQIVKNVIMCSDYTLTVIVRRAIITLVSKAEKNNGKHSKDKCQHGFSGQLFFEDNNPCYS